MLNQTNASNQINNVSGQMIDSTKPIISNDNYYNMKKPTMEQQRNSFYPKMNFTASTVTMASTAVQPHQSQTIIGTNDIVSKKSENSTNKCKFMENVNSQNEQRTLPNQTTQHFNGINSFGSAIAMPNLNSSTNCNYISTPISGQQQQQQLQQQQQHHQQQQQLVQQQQQQSPPPTLYSSNSNAIQIQTIDSQNSQQTQQSQQIFGTKVTRR